MSQAFATVPDSVSAETGMGAETLAGETVPSEPEVVRELIENRTTSSREYLLDNGIVQAQYFHEPIHYEDPATGRLEPVDVAFEKTERSSEGGGSKSSVWTNAANSFEAALPGTLSSEPVTIKAYGTTLSMRPASSELGNAAKVPQGTVSARPDSDVKVSYPQAFVGATLEYESIPSGIKEEIVLDRAPQDGEHVWSFELELDSLVPEVQEDGSITFLRPDADTGEEPVFVIPAPFMTDSNTDVGTGYSDAVYYELSEAPSLEPSDGGEADRHFAYVLDVVADLEWLTDPARVFPARIDPTVLVTHFGGASADDTYIHSTFPATNNSALTVMHTGNTAANGVAYTYIQPPAGLIGDLAAKKASGLTIVGSDLQLYVNSAYAYAPGTVKGEMCVTDADLYLNTLTWNTHLAGAGQAASDYATPDLTLEPYPAGAYVYRPLDVTDMVAHWQEAATAQKRSTVRISAAEGTRVYFSSLDAAANRPYWVTEYAYRPVTTCIFPSGTWTPVPRVDWTYSSASGFPQTAYEIEVSIIPGGAPVASIIGNGNVATAPIPEPRGGFLAGTGYSVRVRTACTPTSQTQRFWSAWSNIRGFIPVEPEMLKASVTTTASGFWAETAPSGSLIPNNQNNTTNQGRGSVSLSWKPVPTASSYLVYLHDGNQFRQVASTVATNWSTVGKNLFPTDSQIAALPSNYTASTNPYASPYAVTDLRDDPRPLYKKAASSVMDDRTDYLFKIQPVSASNGALAMSECATISASLENRTYHVNGDPRHTTYSIDGIGLLPGHSGNIVLDKGAVDLSATDLEIDWWGPSAALSRHYSSGRTASGSWAPGWRFNYEQTVTQSGNIATYTDEIGETHRFGNQSGTWVSAHGFYGTLTKPGDWVITYKDGHRLTFDGTTGCLKSESDRNGNTTTYTPSGNDLVITAGNGHAITVNRNSSGVVSSAAYTASGTGGGTRTITYVAGGTPTVTYYYGSSDTANRTLSLGYTSSRLTSLSHAASGISLGFDYDSAGTATCVRLPGHSVNAFRRADISYPAGSAGNFTLSMVTRYGKIGTSANTAIHQYFVHGLNGLRTGETVPYLAGGAQVWHQVAYSPTHEAIRETAPLGHVSRKSVDGWGLMRESYDADGVHTSYEYNAKGLCTREVDGKGSVTARAYDAVSGDLLTESRTLDRSGATSLATYAYTDPSFPGVRTSEVRSLNATENAISTYSSFAQNGQPGITSQTMRLSPGASGTSIATHRTYTAFGDLADEYLPKAPADPLVVATSNSYTVSGRQPSSADASGTVTTRGYDGLGRMLNTFRTNPGAPGILADYAWNSYGADGKVLAEQKYLYEAGSSGVISSYATYTHDQMGRTVAVSDSTIAGLSGRTDYDAAGNMTASWANGVPDYGATRSSRYAYDADGRMTSTTAPGDSTPTTTTYTPAGREATVSVAGGTTSTYTYDSRGDKILDASVSDAGIALTSYNYDLGGRTVSSLNPEGERTTYTYDRAGRAVSSGAAGQAASTTVYNESGWALRETDADGIVTERAYDPAGRALTESVGVNTPAPKTTTNAYEANGRLAKTTDPDGRSLSYTYDLFGRTLTESHAQGATPIKTVSYTYDSLGRVKTEAHPPRTVSYSYPQNTPGAATRTDTYNGVSTTTNVGTDGLEASRVSTGAGISTITRAVSSRDLGERETQATIGASTFNWEYDSAGRLERQWGAGMASGAKPSNPTYGYNVAGQKSSESLPLAYGGSFDSDYGYNLTDRLAREHNPAFSGNNSDTTYTYDESGNIARAGAATLSYGVDNRLERAAGTPAGSFEVGYNALGQRTSQGPAPNPNSTTFTYTGTGRLASYDTSAVPGVDGTYTYDAAGQRKTSVVKDSAGRTTTIEWVYDGLQLLWFSGSRTDGATWNITYLYDGAGKPYAGIYTGSDSGGTKMPFYLVTTDRGDVVSLLATNGTSFAAYRYDAWGNSAPIQTQAVAGYVSTQPLAQSIAERQVLRYAGYVWDAESKTYYCSARSYDPATMQFLSKDIVKADGEESAYQYCSGDPVGKVDPAGMWAEDIHLGEWVARYGTKYWAMSAGMTTGDAEVVAKANNGLDWNWDTSAFNKFYKGHYRSQGALDYFIERYGGAVWWWNHKRLGQTPDDKKKALQELGKGLHALQDCHAHLWWDPRGQPTHISRNALGMPSPTAFDHVDYDVYRMSNGQYRHVYLGINGRLKSPRFLLSESETKKQINNFKRATNYPNKTRG